MKHRVLPELNAREHPVAEDERHEQHGVRKPKVPHPGTPFGQHANQPHCAECAGQPEVRMVIKPEGQANAQEGHGGGDAAVPKPQRLRGKVLLEAGVGEDTRVRNGDEEQPFFQRQAPKPESREVGLVETPNALGGERDVPCDEAGHGQQTGRPEVLPLLHEPHPTVKAGDERHGHHRHVHPEVGPVVHARCRWLRRAFRASRR